MNTRSGKQTSNVLREIEQLHLIIEKKNDAIRKQQEEEDKQRKDKEELNQIRMEKEKALTSLAGNVGNMSATCWQRVKMLLILINMRVGSNTKMTLTPKFCVRDCQHFLLTVYCTLE